MGAIRRRGRLRSGPHEPGCGDVDEPPPLFDRWLLRRHQRKTVGCGRRAERHLFEPGRCGLDVADPEKTVVLHDVLWDGARFVAVGSDGAVLTGADGAAWTEQPPMYYTLNAIAWDGSVRGQAGKRRGSLLEPGPEHLDDPFLSDRRRPARRRLNGSEFRRGGHRHRALERRRSVLAAGGHRHAANALQRGLERFSFHGRGDRRRASRERGRIAWTAVDTGTPTISTPCAGPREAPGARTVRHDPARLLRRARRRALSDERAGPRAPQRREEGAVFSVHALA